MIHALPDLKKKGGGARAPTLFPRRGRMARVAMPTPEAPAPPSYVAKELSSAANKLLYKGMERLLTGEPQRKKLKAELDESKALPELLKGYTDYADGLPDCVKILALLAEKYTQAAV